MKAVIRMYQRCYESVEPAESAEAERFAGSVV
jgi:hypothetical protein